MKQAQEMLATTEDQAIAILRHFDWNESKMQEKWFDGSEYQ